MILHDVTVPPELDGTRLDKAVAKLIPGLSRARSKRMLGEAIRVNGCYRPKATPVATGDRITVADHALAGSPNAPAEPSADAPLTVAYESESVLVVDKPAGQPTAPLRSGERGTLVNALLGYLPSLQGVGFSPREPGLVHRLDTATSGLVLVAKTASAFETLREALQAGHLQKTYRLVCAEAGLADEGTLTFPLANHPKDSRRVLACTHPRDVMRLGPRPATTDYRVLRRKAPWALVEVVVAKALRHQIRAHFAAIEHPLAGDVLYGGEAVVEHHALHASRLAFAGTEGVEAFDVTSSDPEFVAQLLGAG
jgi:23S rRNA pseudouridine1911/1915/1917 synthase